jgi:DNA-directed RNA polymerase II subunit RPB2
MNLLLIDSRPDGVHPVFDITVDRVHSFLANGVVAHNCIAAHGASTFMRERLFESSDKYQIHVCNECGMIATYNDAKQLHLCNMCENRTNFSEVPLPYACKLLFQELMSMNVVPRIITSESVMRM